MSGRRRKGRSLICLEEEEEEDEVESDEHDDDEDGESSISSFSEDESDDVAEEEEEEDRQSDDDDDEECLCNRVIRLLEEGGDLQALNVKACKAYLRKHSLRVSGTKTVRIQRIKEHWRIKDGNGEVLYPKSSFVINCTGDVCQGDVVLFAQKVYKKFDKVTRYGRFLGKRVIAGRVVKESYGAAKQQHTFTIEILWSKGINKLPPLYPLLVKGRNLYKLRTFRQCWNSEAERVNVLAEKHERGTVARFVREERKAKKTWSTNRGAKHQKHFHHTRSWASKTTELEKRKGLDRLGKAIPQLQEKFINHRQGDLPRNLNFRQNARSEKSQFSQRHKKFHQLNNSKGPALHSYSPPHGPYPSQIHVHQHNAPLHLSDHDMGQTSTMMGLPHFKPYYDMSMMPTARDQGYYHQNYTHHTNSNPNYNFKPRNSNHVPRLMAADRPSHWFSSRTQAFEQRKNGFQPFLR